MNKRFALWGGLVLALAIVAFVMVRLADDDPALPQPERIAANSNTNSAADATERRSDDLLAPRSDDWTKGNPDADVVVVKYSDFQCPACRFYASMDDRLGEELADDVLFIYRHFPLRNFQFSRLAARYTEAAGRQGEFWKMHDLIFINQQRWSRSEAEPIFRQFAETLELDLEQLDRDLNDPALEERIDSHYREGQRLGVRAVPTIFINGEAIRSPNSLDAYRDLILSYK
jgi:protein-disulfide isomerase